MLIYRTRTCLIVVMLIVCAALSAWAWAEAPQVTTTFDRRSITLDDEINLTIRINGAQGNLQRPRLPATDSFTTYYTGRSSQTTQGQASTTTSAEFNFVLVPKAVGKFKFPAVEIQIDEQIYRTASIELEVSDSPTGKKRREPDEETIAPPPPNGSSASLAPVGQGTNRTPSSAGAASYQLPHTQPQGFIPPGADENIFLKAWIDKTEVYPNEQILMTYSLYTRADTQYEGFEEEPAITGFWIESFPNPEKLEKTVVSIGGVRYVRADVRKMALFPQGSGEYTITPGSVKVSVEERVSQHSMFDEFFDDSFFSNRLFSKRIPKILGTEPATITVKPFPPEGRPAHFSGTTGRFTLAAEVDQRSVKQNESITLSLTIEGDGNIETLERPYLADVPSFRLYDSDVSSTLLKRQDKVQGRKVFELVYVPESVGTFAIPSAEFSYFDPILKSYKTLRTEAFQINVAPGEGPPPEQIAPRGRTEPENKQGITVEATDIFFIKEKTAGRAWEAAYPFLPVWWMVNGGLTLFVLALFLYRRSQDMLDTNVALKRRKRAPRVIRRGFRELSKLVKEDSQDANAKFCSLAEKTLNHYIADRMNVSPQSLTRQIIEEEFVKHGPSESDVGRMKRFYDTCHEVIFTRGTIDMDGREGLLESIEAIVKNMEKRKS